MRAQARDSRGQGTAAATITSTMEEVEGGTRVEVETDMRVTGPAAQFGRGVMQDVSAKLMGRFADCLAEQMAGGPAPRRPRRPPATPRRPAATPPPGPGRRLCRGGRATGAGAAPHRGGARPRRGEPRGGDQAGRAGGGRAHGLIVLLLHPEAAPMSDELDRLPARRPRGRRSRRLRRHRLAAVRGARRVGARLVVIGRDADRASAALDAGRRQRHRRRRRRHAQGRRRQRDRRRDAGVRPRRRDRQRRRRRRRQRAVPGRGVPRGRVGPDARPQPALARCCRRRPRCGR